MVARPIRESMAAAFAYRRGTSGRTAARAARDIAMMRVKVGHRGANDRRGPRRRADVLAEIECLGGTRIRAVNPAS